MDLIGHPSCIYSRKSAANLVWSRRLAISDCDERGVVTEEQRVWAERPRGLEGCGEVDRDIVVVVA